MKKKTDLKQYPIIRYLCLLLVVALLFAGVTFSRYQTRFVSKNSVDLAEFGVSYTIDSVNTTSFGNAYYWQWYNGTWMDQGNGTESTVRVTLKNDSAVSVRPTLRLEGPAEFWENIALQIAPVTGSEGSVAADEENPLTTQLVIADLVKDRELAGDDEVTDGSGSTEPVQNEHRFTYGDYIDWGENGSFDTTKNIERADTDGDGEEEIQSITGSDDFGQLGERESVLAMRGKITETKQTQENGQEITTDFSGAVTAVRQRTTVGNEPENSWKMTISASMRDVEFSLGFTRQNQTTNAALPALYLDCEARVPYYTIEIEFPMSVEAKSSDTYVLFLTWTNAIRAKALGIEFPTGDDADDREDKTVPKTFWEDLVDQAQLTPVTAKGTSFTVTGYHFNYTDVRYSTSADGALAEENTTVRLIREFAVPATEDSPATLEVRAYQHIARLHEADAVIPHDMALNGDYYVCVGSTPVYVAKSRLEDLSDDFDRTTLKTMNGGTTGTSRYVGASEKGYSTSISVSFVQSSVVPSTSATI